MLAEDLIETFQEIEDIEQSQNTASEIIFEPANFINIDPSPVKLNYKLGDNVLKYWAE